MIDKKYYEKYICLYCLKFGTKKCKWKKNDKTDKNKIQIFSCKNYIKNQVILDLYASKLEKKSSNYIRDFKKEFKEV